MKIKERRIIVGDPKPVDILIYDEVNSQFVRQAINKKHKVGVFNVRPERIFIGPKIFLKFLKILSNIKIKEKKKIEFQLNIGLLKRIKLIYFISCFEIIKPKAIVTLIDNSTDFHWLSKNCRSCPFIAIQNGSRLSFMADGTKDFYLQHYFCFGEHEIHQFKKNHFTVENFYPVGSLIASLHFGYHKIYLQHYDILIISAWRGNIGFPQDAKDTMQSMRIMDELLAKYIGQRDYKAAIILRAERNGEHWYVPEVGLNEEEYFEGIYGNRAKIIETDFQKRNIFQLMQDSRFIISCLTSALLEGFGIGKKVLFCNFTGKNTYHSDFASEIVTTDSNYEIFSKQLDKLLEMPQQEYESKYNKLAQYYMKFPRRKTTQEVIADTIDEIIVKLI